MSKQKSEWKKAYKDKMKKRGEEARTVRRIVSVIIISLSLIFIIGAYSAYSYIKSSLQPVDPDATENIEVTIPLGSSTSAIGRILEENGVIKDARIFRFYTKFKNESDFQAGDYMFNGSMKIDEIIDSLQQGIILAKPMYKVTIPEGMTVDEIADIYAQKLPFDKQAFLDKANDPSYIQALIEKYPGILSETILDDRIKTPLEGYLFAATYSIYEKEPTIESIIEAMLDKTQSVAGQYFNEMTEQEFSVHEALTFASIVEKEAINEEQRKMISGIFHNRLDNDMRLQTDPTVLYALGIHKGKVLYEDLEVDSPYNTYKIEALPVGPISNFSESALEAALIPEESEYVYFLHDGEGNIYYAKNLDEHNQNKREHIK
ncbi:endolytic transglycosylase MltG [Lentibacillus saliphilus]|uniref:endolytic transglycosylase MltG n=1 Tax=Lentibacillus saliphilus TaxID=2737028 RepID=UPI001C3010BB|nr:endolytic transglycosylase MltG [Lentibacillus saliphilus]